MRSVSLDSPSASPTNASDPDSSSSARTLDLRRVPLLFAALILSALAVPAVRGKPALVASLLAATSVLAIWWFLLRRRAGADAAVFGPAVYTPVRSHYVQALVQFSIYVFWGWYSRGVYHEAPLIAAQVFYLYGFEGLMAWTRGRAWRIGFAPLPVIFSTNLLLWFKPDWYFLQFAMVSVGALGKEFIRWRRDGQSTHVFNPSVFGQSVAGILLIATGTTTMFTYGEELALAFETMSLRHMHIVLFALGLVVQSLFSVTLVTASAVATLCVLNLAYTAATGTYYFITLNVGATVFLGMHLLVTDPATSPRTHLGKVVFGAGYAIGYFALSGIFEYYGVPLFWDKLLPVPVLNLLVPVFDRIARSGIFGRIEHLWNSALDPKRLNLAHMTVWSAIFATMLATDFIDGPHEGKTIEFWKKAYDEGRVRAGPKLMLLVNQRIGYSGVANNVMGLLCLEGKLVKKDENAAITYFARACEFGFYSGCENVAGQYLLRHRAYSLQVVDEAFDCLEREADQRRDGDAHFLLGLAYESGLGRPFDVERAILHYDESCKRGNPNACKGAERVRAGEAIGAKLSPAELQRRRVLLEEAQRSVGVPNPGTGDK